MTVLDANIFLYAYNKDEPQQRAAAEWLKELYASGETVALPWITVWAFIRISTNHRLWVNPMAKEQAFSIMEEWLGLPGVVGLEPGPRHFELLRRLAVENKATGAMLSDTALAALALENGAALASTDQDFARFSGLRWLNPLNV